MIIFDRVTYTYPGAPHPALHDVSLRLPEGELTVLVGESGAGKSTLLRCINGLAPHFTGGALSGTIRVNGLDPVQAGPQAMSRHVGFVFQDPESQFVLDHVEEEIAFALENAAVPPQSIRVRVEEVLDLLDLEPLRDRPIATLSGGEKQRVAIAAALVLRPAILVLDEPTSQLDPKSAEDVLNALARLNADLGLTIVLAEHRLERVLPFADRLVYLTAAGGELLSGEPRRVLEQIDLAPPLARLGKALGWSPLPLTTKEGLRFSRALHRTQAAESETRREAAPPRPSARPFIAVRNAAHTYRGGRPALRGVTLEVWPGEIVTLLGRNGAGKSTLLKSIVGLVRPARGAVLVDGEDVREHPTAAICRKVGYLPQDPNALLFADEVQQELGITLRNHGLPAETPAALDRIASLLARLHLGDKAAAYPRDLSVGERQRVALAAVTVTAPGALILDEPTRGLDYVAKSALAALLRQWRAEGMAILLVTHDVELAAALADRVLLMSQGEIIAEGPPGEVMGASPLFAPQMARLFPGRGWLTVEDVLGGTN